MAIDPARFRGRETTTEALGQKWTFSRFTIDIWEPFLDWAASKLPDPIDVAEEKAQRLAEKVRKIKADPKLSDEDRDYQVFINERMQGMLGRIGMEEALSYLSPGSPRVQSLIKSPIGGAYLLKALLSKHHPDVSLEECGWMVQEIEDAEFERIIRVTSGKLGPQGNG